MSVKRLCIDSGHAMGNSGNPTKYDPGAVAGGHTEAAIALSVGLSVKAEAVLRGLPVFLTRDDATDVTPVSTRASRANAANCSHFLSLHLNAGPEQAHGVETLYRDEADKAFAAKIHAGVLRATGLKDRGLKHESESARGRLAVFGFDGPACLVELGFITNGTDRGVLLKRETRIRIADEIIDACIGEDGNDG